LPVGDHQGVGDEQSEAEQIKPPRSPSKAAQRKRECGPDEQETECKMLIRPIQQQQPDRRKSRRLLQRGKGRTEPQDRTAPMKVAAVLWLMKVAVRLPR